MSGEFIQIDAGNGQAFSAYMAAPAQGSGPGLDAAAGNLSASTDYMKAMADRFAEEGYVVLVPDLFWRMKPRCARLRRSRYAPALGYIGQFDLGPAIDDIASTVAALRAMPEGRQGRHNWVLPGRQARVADRRAHRYRLRGQLLRRGPRRVSG